MTPKHVIGKAQQLPWHLPADLAYFKAATLGKSILMGRLTFESIGRPLPGRDNWIISTTLTAAPKGTYLAPSLSAALAQLQHQPEIMVIGGGQLYQAALPLAQQMLLTIVEADIAGDIRFPEWPTDLWHLVAEQTRDADSNNPYRLRFQKWTRI